MRTEGDWDVLEVDYADPERFAEWVAGYGADVVVTAPADVRDAVIRRLRAALTVDRGTIS